MNSLPVPCFQCVLFPAGTLTDPNLILRPRLYLSRGQRKQRGWHRVRGWWVVWWRGSLVGGQIAIERVVKIFWDLMKRVSIARLRSSKIFPAFKWPKPSLHWQVWQGPEGYPGSSGMNHAHMCFEMRWGGGSRAWLGLDRIEVENVSNNSSLTAPFLLIPWTTQQGLS